MTKKIFKNYGIFALDDLSNDEQVGWHDGRNAFYVQDFRNIVQLGCWDKIKKIVGDSNLSDFDDLATKIQNEKIAELV